MTAPRTGPWTKEEHAETLARLARVDSGEEDGIDIDDYDTLMEEATWMGSEALPRALDEIERLEIANAAGWAIAKARLECLDKVNAEIARLTNAKLDPRGAAMALELFGGAGEVAGLRARHAKAQAEADDLAQALREHPDAKPEDKPTPSLAERMRLAFHAFDRAISEAQGAYHNHQQWGPEQWDPITRARTDFYDAFEATLVPNFGGAPEVELRSRIDKAQTEVDDLTKALLEHPDRKLTRAETIAKLRRETFERIAALPKEEQHKAAVRASRSFSVPKACIEREGCRIEGMEMVWPDGERYLTRVGE